jgi:peptide/nickel transport system permease protein
LASTSRRRKQTLSLSLMVALAMLAVILLLIVVTPFLPVFDPVKQNLMHSLDPPFVTTKHVLGTDALGRDTLSRLSVAVRVSVLVSLGAVAISATVGLIIGLVTGWLGGATDGVLMAIGNIQLAVPVVLLLIVLVAVLGSSPVLLVVLLGLTNWVSYGRVVRAQVVSLKEREFITAVTTAGGSGFWIMRKHLLPNVTPSVLVLAAFDVGVIITIESSLSFIGLGIQPPTPSLGLMIAEAQRYMQTNLSLTLFPALTIFLLIGGIQFAFLGLTSSPKRGR